MLNGKCSFAPHSLILATFKGDCILNSYSTRTAIVATYDLKRFLVWWDRPLEELRQVDVRRFLTFLLTTNSTRGSPRSPNTIIAILKHLKMFGAWAAEREIICCDVFGPIKGPRHVTTLMYPLADDEMRLILNRAHTFGDTTELAARNVAAVYLLADTGMRAGELLKLRNRDVLTDGRLKVLGKGSRERIVQLSPEIERLLAAYIAVRRAACDSLFINKYGGPWTYPGLKRLLDTMRVQLAIPGLHAHAFRRTALTKMYASGMSQGYLKAISGHSSDNALYPYIHAANVELAVDAAKVHSPVRAFLKK